MIIRIFVSLSLLCIFMCEFLCVEIVLVKNTTSSFLAQNDKKYRTNTVYLEDKQENVNNIPGERRIDFNWPAVNMTNMIKTLMDNHNELKVKQKRESVYFKRPAATSVWDFGGTWSSELAGVRFEMDSRSTVGVDKNIPVRILQDGTRLNGFLNKGWMAKANAQYGRYGPVTLFAINRPERNVAAFVGFVHSQNNKDIVTGMWSMGRNCRSNLDIHQSVFNIPDVLRRDST